MAKGLELASWIQVKIVGIKIKLKVWDSNSISYEYYLGPNYRSEYKPPNKETGGIVSTICSNHVSCFDIQTLATCMKGNVTFAAGAFTKNVPIIGGITKLLGCVFVPRAGSKAQLNDTLRSLVVRAQINEEKGTYPPTIIFPEGTTSNNMCLLKFRKGAFYSMRQVIPVTLKYHF